MSLKSVYKSDFKQIVIMVSSCVGSSLKKYAPEEAFEITFSSPFQK